MMRPDAPHIPIMVRQVISLLVTNPSGIYLDGTVGFGGHASAILEMLEPGGRLIGLDCDPDALDYTGKYLSSHFSDRTFSLHHMNFHKRSPTEPTFIRSVRCPMRVKPMNPSPGWQKSSDEVFCHQDLGLRCV